MASLQSSAEQLSEALGVDLETSCAALRTCGGDADAAAASILAAGQQGGGGGGEPATSALGRLLEMGYARAEAEQALAATDGDLEEAIAQLLGGAQAQARPAELVGAGAQGGAAGGGGGPATGALGTLLEIGYTRAEAEQALAATHGDLEEAISQLLSGAQAEAPPAEHAGGGAADTEVDLGVCAICCEELRATDAAMRCDGRAGSYHYGHAACLAQWVQRCRRDGATPSCPTCRGPLQLHRRNLRDFLQQGTGSGGTSSNARQASGCRVSQQESELLHSMLDQEGERCDEDDPWSDIDFEDLAKGILAVGAVAVLAFGASALIDHFSKKRERSQS